MKCVKEIFYWLNKANIDEKNRKYFICVTSVVAIVNRVPHQHVC